MPTTTEEIEEMLAANVIVGQRCWVFHLEHKNGGWSDVYSTPEKAMNAVHNWVKQWWHSDGPGKYQHELPVDRDEAIRSYFNEHPYESYTIEEETVL